MRRILILAFLVTYGGFAFAKPIDEATAKTVGQNFLAFKLPYAPGDVTLSYKAYAPVSVLNTFTTQQPAVYIYIFSAGKNAFVMVSGDDRITPILGYSNEGGFISKNMPGNVTYMLNTYTGEIDYAVKNNISATKATTNQWTNLINNTISGAQPKSSTYVAPLLKELTWDQQPYYNALCPYDYSVGEQTVTGCVATAMAQVMRFWKYPAKGTGYNSYTPYGYSAQTVNFANVTYQWSDMPNILTDTNNAVATLMYDCGVAVDMRYGPPIYDGSGAWVITPNPDNTKFCAENALKTYFGYSSSLQGLQRSNYSDAKWVSLLQADISAGRPVIYSGFDPSNAGHCFVFDGYDIVNGNNYFHVNWGWSGMDDTYYVIDSLVPNALGVGGGKGGGFGFNQAAVMGIQPPAITTTSGIQNISAAGNLVIYPNPAQNYTIADLTGFDGTPQLLTLINTEGKIVYSANIGTDKTNIRINTENIPNGVYFVRILTDKGTLNSKLVVVQ